MHTGSSISRRISLHNNALVNDYLMRAGSRLKAVKVLAEEESWADVVWESQEIVEITLKALLRSCRIEVPRIHDVSPVLDQNRDRLGDDLQSAVDKLIEISRSLRRDRELALYGSEDLTPSEFYKERDAVSAFEGAHFVYTTVSAACKKQR